jgi:hypothetical protein
MDTTSFIEAFRCLQTHEREQALEALTNELSPSDWIHLHAITSTRSFQHDIIGNLPVELVAQIFRHLDTTCPYRYQIVSRRWNNTLRSLHILKASLSQWYSNSLTPDLQGADYAWCAKRARRTHAFRSGNPITILKIFPTDKIREVLLRGDNLIWQQPQNYRDTIRSAYILHLPTFHLRSISGEAREQLRDVFASSDLVVLTTFANICYVHSLHAPYPSKKFRVPSKAYFSNISVRSSTVACIAELKDHTDVYIWDFCTGRGTSFKIEHTPDSLFSVSVPEYRDMQALVQPRTSTILIFTSASVSTTQPQQRRNVAYARYTYAGECIGMWQPFLPGIGNIMSWSNIRCWNDAGYDGRWAMWMKSRPWSTSSDADSRVTTSFILRFDEKDCKLDVWPNSSLVGSDCGFYTGGCMAWWKDTCYGYLHPSDSAETRDMLAFMGTQGEGKYKALVDEGKEIKMAHAWENVTAPVQMNEKYVLRNVLDRFYLLCFDEDEGENRPRENGEFFDQGMLEVLK